MIKRWRCKMQDAQGPLLRHNGWPYRLCIAVLVAVTTTFVTIVFSEIENGTLALS